MLDKDKRGAEKFILCTPCFYALVFAMLLLVIAGLWWITELE